MLKNFFLIFFKVFPYGNNQKTPGKTRQAASHSPNGIACRGGLQTASASGHPEPDKTVTPHGFAALARRLKSRLATLVATRAWPPPPG